MLHWRRAFPCMGVTCAADSRGGAVTQPIPPLNLNCGRFATVPPPSEPLSYPVVLLSTTLVLCSVLDIHYPLLLELDPTRSGA